MEEIVIPLSAILVLFVGLPWLVMHYLTKWKQAKSITIEDEDLLDELHDIARRLDERLTTIERIVAADHGALDPRVEGGVRPQSHSQVQSQARHQAARYKEEF